MGATESWNGTSWTIETSLSTGRTELGDAGSNNTSALAFGGETPPVTTATEEWTGAGTPLTQTIDTD